MSFIIACGRVLMLDHKKMAVAVGLIICLNIALFILVLAYAPHVSVA
jgi:hypothetical protein